MCVFVYVCMCVRTLIRLYKPGLGFVLQRQITHKWIEEMGGQEEDRGKRLEQKWISRIGILKQDEVLHGRISTD